MSDGVSNSVFTGNAKSSTEYAFLSVLIQEGTFMLDLVFVEYSGEDLNFSRSWRMSHGLINVDGILCFTPFRLKWPWVTIWRACIIVCAKPERRIITSALLSKNWNNAISWEILWFFAYLEAVSLTILENCFSDIR